MSIIVGGRAIAVPGLETISWMDDPVHVPRATDGSRRTTFIRAIVLHTVHGRVGRVAPGVKPGSRAEWYARYQARTPRQVSWDYCVDTDGTVAVTNDPLERACWHGHTVNAYSVGIELVQDGDGTLYAGQLTALVLLVDALTRELGVQRQTFVGSDRKPFAGRIPRCDSGQNGRNLCGIYGHRNVWPGDPPSAVRGFGDPNSHPFEYLIAAGYEAFDPLPSNARQGDPGDVAAWKARQRTLGFPDGDVDGVPGPKTRRALADAGRPHGLWIKRPGD